jgi:hypothetical protein
LWASVACVLYNGHIALHARAALSIFIPFVLSFRLLMTIPTVETLQRRRSFCTPKSQPPQSISLARCQTPLDHSDLPTQRISCTSRSPPLRERREKRKHRILEVETAIPFTQVSNFHSRKLPPLGTHAHNLDLPFGHTDPFHVCPFIVHKPQAADLSVFR